MKIDMNRRPGKTYMVKKMREQICANCGYEKKYHTSGKGEECNFLTKPTCKKFTPKNHSPQGKSSKKSLLNYHPEDAHSQLGVFTHPVVSGKKPFDTPSDKTQFSVDAEGTQNQEVLPGRKGCGNMFWTKSSSKAICNPNHLCPECQEKEK